MNNKRDIRLKIRSKVELLLEILKMCLLFHHLLYLNKKNIHIRFNDTNKFFFIFFSEPTYKPNPNRKAPLMQKTLMSMKKAFKR